MIKYFQSCQSDFCSTQLALRVICHVTRQVFSYKPVPHLHGDVYSITVIIFNFSWKGRAYYLVYSSTFLRDLLLSHEPFIKHVRRFEPQCDTLRFDNFENIKFRHFT